MSHSHDECSTVTKSYVRTCFEKMNRIYICIEGNGFPFWHSKETTGDVVEGER